MIVKRLFLIIWISMPLSVSLGDEPDSLDQVLEATKNTKRKVDILNVFNREYTRGDTDRPINRFRTALQLAEEIRYIDGIAIAHENMANYFFRNRPHGLEPYKTNDHAFAFRQLDSFVNSP